MARGKRNVANEKNAVVISRSGAKSSHEALYYHLIAPETIRRLALRMTEGSKKYGSVQWRRGLNDAEYVRDRFNHLWEHVLKLQQYGQAKDDNLGAMLWAINCLIEAERLCPKAFKSVFGSCELFGEAASKEHDRQMARKGLTHDS